MRISDWSSDVCSSDLAGETAAGIRIAAELYDAHPDLTGSWLAWAAAMGNRLAALALIARLKERPAEQVWEAEEREGTLAPEDADLPARAASWRNREIGRTLSRESVWQDV